MTTKLAARMLTALGVLFALTMSASAQEIRIIDERIIQVADEPKPGEKPAPPMVVYDSCCTPKPCCQKPCRPPMVCVPEPSKRTLKETVYSSKESPYCLKKCSHPFGGLFGKGCCDPCGGYACGECDKVRYKNVLLKRSKTVGECPDYKCVPKPAPCQLPCGHGVIIEKTPEPAPKPMPK